MLLLLVLGTNAEFGVKLLFVDGQVSPLDPFALLHRFCVVDFSPDGAGRNGWETREAPKGRRERAGESSATPIG